MSFVWDNTVVRIVHLIPERFRLATGAIGTIFVVLIGTFTSPQSADNTHGNRAIALFGLLVFIGAFYITSNNRNAINWHTVIVGMLAQFILALFVLRTQTGVSNPLNIQSFGLASTFFVPNYAHVPSHFFGQPGRTRAFSINSIKFDLTENIVRYLQLYCFPGHQSPWICSQWNRIPPQSGCLQTSMVRHHRHPTHHLLRSLCTASVLLGLAPMGYWKVRLLLLLVHACFRCRSRGGRCFSFRWSG
jgi:Na+ dependent nucleoside transporter N-terminus